MEGQNEEDEGLPDIYLSPTHHQRTDRNSGPTSNDSDQNVWDETDGEIWVPLNPEMTTNEMDTSLESQHQMTCALGMREEIEGKSSLESSAAGNSMVTDASQSQAANSKQPKRKPEGAGNSHSELSQLQTVDIKVKEAVKGDRMAAWPKQRGETPGSDCPPVAGTGALPRTFRQNLSLDTNLPSQLSSELVFSPGGDEGFMVPGGVHAYYESGSDTEGLEWSMGEEYQGAAGAPYREVVEGADSATPVPQNYGVISSSGGLRAMERNSPAGLSTPDADVDLTVSLARTQLSRKTKSSIRPPGVGQSEELLVQSSRKDLGSTDGEESEEDGTKRAVLRNNDIFATPEAQPGSLGSQSENTDSVNTVLDMSRGEVQGCENDETIGVPVLSPPEAPITPSTHKPSFVIGGAISPRGKFRQFQNTVRGRMQDVKASLEVQPGLDLGVHVDRDQFLSQPPLYTPVTPVSEQETSLASMISVETNHPDSSDRVTSPSVLSVSSAASSKRLEWDSGADVGYVGNTPEMMSASLSTLERIAIGNYASVLRTEPEGTTQVKEKLRSPKKSYKASGAKGGGSLTNARRSVPEVVGPLPSRLLRVPQIRERNIMSSSDEDFDSRLTSPSQSPRRKPRRRSTNVKDSDNQVKRQSGGQSTQGRIREIMREISSEGKSSSLVELHQTKRSTVEYRRSSSQQSLNMSHAVKEGNNIMKESNSHGKSGPTASAISRNTVAAINANTSTSTSTLVQSMSPLPAQGISASTSGTLVEWASHSRSELGTNKSSDSSQSSLQKKEKDSCLNVVKRTCVSSGNDVSSKSQESSDLETPSDMKDTDLDSCNSLLHSDDEPVNQKAKKNSRNARSYSNISRPCRQASSACTESGGKSKCNKNDTKSIVSKEQKGEILDSSESVLESQVSLQASNNTLQALSVKLKHHIQLLLDQGTMKKVQDYNKLQDYIEFIGIPSTNEEECRLKHGVAGVITRMFGEIEADDTDTSNTFNSETSEAVTTDSHVSENSPQNQGTSDFTPTEGQSKTGLSSADPSSISYKSVNEQEEEQESSITPGGTITLRAYRPPSATRTYFMAVSKECDEGLVQAERTVTPDSGPSSATFVQGLEFHRGQAEGQREETESGIPSLSPRSWQQEDRNYPNAEDDSSAQDMGVRGASGRVFSGSNRNDEDTESFSETVTLPPGWALGLRKNQALSSGAVTSDECSPRHVGRWSVLDRRSSWHEEELNSRFRNAEDWKTATTRSERLYKDRRGTLHVANQPPGYMDDRDSHPSESTSEHEHQQHRGNDTESHDDGRRAAIRPWTSSGSESAYETIRERHRHVDEALASSFEFYSTSPRDARLLGYMSSDAAKDEDAEEEHEPINEETSQADHMFSPPSSEQQSTNRAVHSKKRSSRRQNTEELNSTHSSHTDANDVSSQVSFIQLQKQKYVKRIQRHIQTLEKLERALMEQLGDSIGSEKSFRRCVTEGRSQTESDTNVKAQTRDILGQSETATSSIISSDYSDDIIENRSDRIQQGAKGHSSRSRSTESQITGHENQSQSSGKKSESIKSGTGMSGFNSLGQSYMSSPRLMLNQLAPNLTSSRASTLKSIEKEVKKLALAEERSRQVLHRNQRKHARSGLREGAHFQNALKKMQREEPRGEEGPKKSQVKSARVYSDDRLSEKSIKSDRNKVDAVKQHHEDKTAKLYKVKSFIVSDEDLSDKSISNSQLLRQGDGREAKDGSQVPKAPPLVYKNNTRSHVDSTSVQGIQKNDTQKGTSSHNFGQIYPSKQSSPKVLRSHDFGQMFPSVESFALSDDENDDCDQNGRSIGIQTGESLLCLTKSKVNAESLEQHTDKVRPASNQRGDLGITDKRSNKTNESERQTSRPDSGKSRHEHKAQGNHPEMEKQAVNKVGPDRQFVERPMSRPNSREGRPNSREGISEHANKKPGSASSSRPGSSREAKKDIIREKRSEMQRDAKTSLRQVIGHSQPTNQTGSLNRPGSRPEDRQISDMNKKHQKIDSGRESKHDTEKLPSSRQVSAREKTNSKTNERSAKVHSSETSLRISEGPIESYRSEKTSDTGKQSDSDNQKATSITDNYRQREEGKNQPKSPSDESDESLIVLKDQGQSSILSSVCSSEGSSVHQSYQDQAFVHENGSLLPVSNYSSSRQGTDTNREYSHRKGMNKSQRDKIQIANYRKPVQFNISVGNKENYPQEQTIVRDFISAPVMPSAGKSKKDMTLQEALVKARPKYIREAEDRWTMIRWKREMRRDAQNHNHKVVSQLPANLQTPSTLQRFLYKPEVAPLFTYRDIRKQNQRIYELLPEARNPEVKQFRKAQSQTNRLMAGIYSQKLKKKVLKGQVSHAHKDILTPPAVSKY